MKNDYLPVVVSGIRATGRMHLGNYIGAMKNFSELQDENKCYFFIADFHTLTSLTSPKLLQKNLPEIVLDYLAAGLDPNKSIIFAQSSVPQIPELALLLGMLTYIGELQRCPTFKEKVKKQPDNVNLGLFSYPVLMAADILIQKANFVPVGEDQLPHIEMTRNIARRFNAKYSETFPLPESFKEKAVKVPGLDGTGKMGKSEGNTIDLKDSKEEITKKISLAVTDTKRIQKKDIGHPYECNLFTIHEFVSGLDFSQQIKTDCESAKIGCVECKKILTKSLIDFLAPFQARRIEISKDPDYIKDVLISGGKAARESAKITLDEVRERMGLNNL